MVLSKSADPCAVQELVGTFGLSFGIIAEQERVDILR